MDNNISSKHNTVFIFFLTFLFFSISGCGSAQKLKLTNSSKTPIFTANIPNVTCLALSPDNLTVYAGQSNGKVIAYDISHATSIPLDINCEGRPSHIAVHPNGAIIGIGTSKKSVELWDIKQNKRLMTLSCTPMHLNSFCFSSTGSMIMAAYSCDSDCAIVSGSLVERNSIIIWDTDNGRMRRRFDWQAATVADAKFSPDENSVFSVGGDCLQWDITTGKILKTFTGKHGHFKGIN
ncbi:MAG: hypothetical protein NTW55_05445, partial [Planctomycetota bacterium]|nr:hypothetical protein [Planctomycetota bacterium]